MNTCIIMLQNKLLTIYFELKLQVPKMENISLREPSDLCMCPFYSGQVIDRCACSGSSCLNAFCDMFMTRLWKGEILDNLPVKRSGANKNVCLKIFHI